MRFCQAHWDKLREALSVRGLDQFIAKDGQEVIGKLVTELQDPSRERSSFEPLMGAHWAIVNNAMNVTGLAVLSPNEDGSDRCPLCYLIKNCTCGEGDSCPFTTWIDRAADDQKEHAKELGLIGSS